MRDTETPRAKLPTATADLLVKLTLAQQKLNAENERIAGIVHELRESGISWESIGTKLGVTKQAAQQRFGDR
jgi:hypothetical protein